MLLLTKPLSRSFATNLTNSSVRRIRRTKMNDKMSFEDFVLKGQVLQTYRKMLRTVAKIPDQTTRKEVHDYVKGEFKSSQSVKKIEIKESLLTGGIQHFQSLANNLGLSMPDIDFGIKKH